MNANRIDYGLLKVQYELFNQPVTALAEEYGVSVNFIKLVIKEKGWKRVEQNQADDLPMVIGEGQSGVLDAVNERLNTLRTLKRATLDPSYVTLETSILTKMLEAVNHLNPEMPTTISLLKTAAAVFNELREGGRYGRKQEQEQAKGVHVTIQTKSANIMAKGA